MKLFYGITYRYFRAPWDTGPREGLVNLVESGRIQPCKAIDLGSGTASNCIFLAQRGFDVTGEDFAQAAVELGRKRAQAAGVTVNFIQDDLNEPAKCERRLRPAGGLWHHGRSQAAATRSLSTKRAATHPSRQPVRVLLFRVAAALVAATLLFSLACEPGEVKRRFNPYFEIEKIAGEVTK